MSKLNHKHFVLALAALSPMMAWSPSELLVKREMASLGDSATAGIEDLKNELKLQKEGTLPIPIPEIVKDAPSDDAFSITEKEKAKEEEKIAEEKAKEKKDEEVDESKEEKKKDKIAEALTLEQEEEKRSCERRNEVQDLEGDVERVISENKKLIEKFEKLNKKYNKDLAETKKKALPEANIQMNQNQMDFLTLGILALLMQNQRPVQQYSYLANPLNQMPYFSGPGWNYLPSQSNNRLQGSPFASWEHSYYNIPTMGIVDPTLTPSATSLTKDLYPAIYNGNGTGRTLRSPSEIAPSRGYKPEFLPADATSQRLNQNGIVY